MAYSGLRGGIAFFLAMSLTADVFPNRKLFITTTIVVVYFTVIVLVCEIFRYNVYKQIAKLTESATPGYLAMLRSTKSATPGYLYIAMLRPIQNLQVQDI